MNNELIVTKISKKNLLEAGSVIAVGTFFVLVWLFTDYSFTVKRIPIPHGIIGILAIVGGLVYGFIMRNAEHCTKCNKEMLEEIIYFHIDDEAEILKAYEEKSPKRLLDLNMIEETKPRVSLYYDGCEQCQSIGKIGLYSIKNNEGFTYAEDEIVQGDVARDYLAVAKKYRKLYPDE